jgi:hypothetical protein
MLEPIKPIIVRVMEKLMSDSRHLWKGHLWNSVKDPARCCACGRAFVIGDKIISDVAVAYHGSTRCIARYQKDAKELGLLPKGKTNA